MNTKTKAKSTLHLLLPFLVALIFDQLFFDGPWGVNFTIFILLLVGVGIFLGRSRSASLQPRSALLLIPIAVFSIFTFIRSDGFTIFISVFLTFISLLTLITSYANGRWFQFSLSDHIEKIFSYVLYLITKPFMLLGELRQTNSEGSKTKNKTSIAIFRGVIIAIPFLLVLTALLISADMVFESNLKGLFSFLNWDNIGELTFRFFEVAFLSIFIGVTYLYAHTQTSNTDLRGVEKPALPKFLGGIEALVVLSMVNLLFLAFVIVQFQYLFGGQTNIHIDGYTYAEYARKGFGELSFVAVISLLLLQAIHSFTAADEPKQNKFRTILSIVMVAQLLVMLFSAYQRLTLYEAAYGFSQRRAYTHIFLVWIAILLVAIAALEATQRSRFFTTAVILAAFGFGITLDLLNVDARVAQWNIQRAANGAELDVAYLASLSDDAIPQLARDYLSPATSPEIKDQVGAVLACHRYKRQDLPEQSIPWYGFTISGSRARSTLNELDLELSQYLSTKDENGTPNITLDQTSYPCY